MTTARPTRPKWTAVTAVLGACAVVWLASDLTGPTAASSAQLPTVRPTTTTATPTTPTAPAKATVSRVVDARTVLTSAGEQVVVAGLAPPGPCWAAAALDFATVTLLGADVAVVDPVPVLAGTLSAHTPTTTVRAVAASLVLPDGTDYASAALHQGHAKPTRDADAPLHAAATASGASFQGLWGQPCLGEDVLPVPVPPPVAIPTTATAPPPPDAAKTAKVKNYYRNCAAARAAGQAPIPRGTPGYRPALDSDRNGLACER